jgi:hypothetical protein
MKQVTRLALAAITFLSALTAAHAQKANPAEVESG